MLGGRYRLVELLGQGGMATIYRATDTQLGRDVAVKLLRPEYLRDPDFSSRFRFEARAAASLSHPNIVGVHDYGEDPDGPFIVMELVDGEDLASILRANGALPPRQAARDRVRGGPGTRRGPRQGDRPPRRQAGERPRRPRRPGQGGRLRDRPGRRRVGADAAGDDARVRPLLQPRAGAGRGNDRVRRHLLAGHRPVRDAHRAAAVGGRQCRFRGNRAAQRPDPRPADVPAVGSRRARRDRPARAGTRAGQPLELGCVVRRCAGRLAGHRPGAGHRRCRRGRGRGRRGCRGRGRCRSRRAGRRRRSDDGGGRRAIEPRPIPYAPDAYAGGTVPPGTGTIDEVGDEGTSPWVWVAGVAAIVLLAVVGFLVFQILSPGERGAETVVSARLHRDGVAEAAEEADRLDVDLVQTSEESEEEVGTILAQDPAPGTEVAVGSEVADHGGRRTGRGRRAEPP